MRFQKEFVCLFQENFVEILRLFHHLQSFHLIRKFLRQWRVCFVQGYFIKHLFLITEITFTFVSLRSCSFFPFSFFNLLVFRGWRWRHILTIFMIPLLAFKSFLFKANLVTGGIIFFLSNLNFSGGHFLQLSVNLFVHFCYIALSKFQFTFSIILIKWGFIWCSCFTN